MNCRLIFTDTAKNDLRDIALYIAEQSKDKNPAIRFVGELRDKCDILKVTPECGSLPKDRILISNGYRFLVHDNYLIFYCYIENESAVYITAIFNAKRDYLRVMKRYI